MTDNLNLVRALADRGEKLFSEDVPSEEKLIAKIQGNFGQALVLTDKKLYVLKWGAWAGSIFGGRCITFDFDRITGVKITTGLGTGTLEILTAATQNRPKSFWGSGQDNANQADDAITFSADLFAAFREIANRCNDMTQHAKYGNHQNGSSDIADLEKLATLKEKGVITQEEFDAKKKQILGL